MLNSLLKSKCAVAAFFTIALDYLAPSLRYLL